MTVGVPGRVIPVLLAVVLALPLAAGMSGCSSPCSGHGGVRAELGGWYYCNDGTREYG